VLEVAITASTAVSALRHHADSADRIIVDGPPGIPHNSKPTLFMQKYAASSALTKNIFLLDILNKPYNPYLAAKHCRHLCYFCICLFYWHCMLRMRSYPFSLFIYLLLEMSLFGFIVIISKNIWEVTTLCVIWCQKLNNTIRDQIRCKKIETLGSCKTRHFQMNKLVAFI
jgi:hypothetical protein